MVCFLSQFAVILTTPLFNQMLLYHNTGILHILMRSVYLIVRAGVKIVVLAVVNSAQVDEALFGHKGVVSGNSLHTFGLGFKRTP